MSTNHTPNYNLSQWEADDKVLRTEFNEDNAKLDAALGGLERTVSSHTSVLSGLKNGRVHIEKYTGTGKWGPGAYRYYTLPATPQLLLIFGPEIFLFNIPGTSSSPCARRDVTEFKVLTSTVSWSGSTFHISSTNSSEGYMNISGVTYVIVAIYQA